MENIKSFRVGSDEYNVARANAFQQDEVLSLLSSSLILRLTAAGESGVSVDETLIQAMIFSMPFELKQRVDELLMSRIIRNGGKDFVSIKDFDGKVMDYNLLRTKVLMWNLEGFFTYWAKESENAKQAMK